MYLLYVFRSSEERKMNKEAYSSGFILNYILYHMYYNIYCGILCIIVKKNMDVSNVNKHIL